MPWLGWPSALACAAPFWSLVISSTSLSRERSWIEGWRYWSQTQKPGATRSPSCARPPSPATLPTGRGPRLSQPKKLVRITERVKVPLLSRYAAVPG